MLVIFAAIPLPVLVAIDLAVVYMKSKPMS
jgi:hypothetical protein